MEPSETKKKSIQDLSKEELLVVFEKLRQQTVQLSQAKKDAEQQLDASQIEKEEIRKKAHQVVLRCKELEKRNQELEAAAVSSSASETASTGIDGAPIDERLAALQKESAKYKEAFDQLAQKFRSFKAVFEEQKLSLQKANEELSHLKNSEPVTRHPLEDSTLGSDRSSISQLETKISELQAKLLSQNEINIESAGLIQSLQHQLNEEQREKASATAALERVTSVYHEAQTNTTRLEGEVASLRRQLGEQVASDAARAETLLSLEQEKAVLHEHLASLQRAQESSAADLERVTSVYNEAQEAVGRLEGEVASLRSQLGEQGACESAHAETLSALESEVRALQEKVSAQETEVEQLKSSGSADLERVTTAYNAALEEIGQLKETVARLEEARGDEVSELSSRLAEYKTRNSKALERLKETIATVKEKTDEVEMLRARLTEAEELYESRCREFNSLSGSYEDVTGQLTAEQERAVAAESRVAALESSLVRWKDDAHATEQKLRELEEAKNVLEAQFASIDGDFQRLHRMHAQAPTTFTVVLRIVSPVSTTAMHNEEKTSAGDADQQGWCLLLRRDALDSAAYYQWQDDDTVIRWATERHLQRLLAQEQQREAAESADGGDVSSFSIAGQDDDDEEEDDRDLGGVSVDDAGQVALPVAVQVAWQQRYQSMQRELQQQLDTLRAELESNRVAFDRYRDRAKETLRGSIAEQKELESKLATVQDEHKQEQTLREKADKRCRMLEMQVQTADEEHTRQTQEAEDRLQEVQSALQQAQEEIQRLIQEYATYRDQEMANNTLEQTMAAVRAEYDAEIGRLREQVDDLQQKESHWEKEVKKRGDAARHMLMEKDREIEHVRATVVTLQQQVQQLQQQQQHHHHQQHQQQHGVAGGEQPQQQAVLRLPENHSSGSLSSVAADSTAQARHHSLDDILSSEEKRVFDELQDHAASAAQQAKLYEDVYRHARVREAELLDIIKMLKAEVNSMRKRFSLISSERSGGGSGGGGGGATTSHSGSFIHTPHKASFRRPHTRSSSSPRPTTPGGSGALSTRDLEYEGHDMVPVDRYVDEEDGPTGDEGSVFYDPEQEARLMYLKQAFSGFFRAKNTVEMQHLGRVICAILGVDIEEQATILESITKLSPAVVATSTIESITQQLASIFN